MKLSLQREHLLRPLTLVAGVVERRGSLPVLNNLLFEVSETSLKLTGSDLEVELQAEVTPLQVIKTGNVTVPAKKLLDICKSLPEQAELTLELEEQRLLIRSGRSRFTLTTLPAEDFPKVKDADFDSSFGLPQARLKYLIEHTAFAMAQQDVRYYLNGMFLELDGNTLRTVTTDGHRLALCAQPLDTQVQEERSGVIIPRKGVIELSRLLEETETPVTLALGRTHMRAQLNDYLFTSKLVDGKFPDYERVIPRNGQNVMQGERQALKQVFNRTAILSNEKYRGVRLILSSNHLQVLANNPEQEEAEEQVSVDYHGSALEICFNVSYLLDILNALDSEHVEIALSDSNSSALIQDAGGGAAQYVVMPMRLS
ncbi:DNA polymerase-3 subunit beta [Allopseudospirillum japonicum]|uniref:Beta sliding clamp n=1 Tax=Allopseudospirillum japonicum TaxID=64971 RepID=A0A1H6R5Q3_9GAMM|nr:DNA polymerase III subunit beta [Allopseudospirillum japonicum]SEI49766.1 DNA polymerase-3 subunit beta [Allopseudospirillum japonicum]